MRLLCALFALSIGHAAFGQVLVFTSADFRPAVATPRLSPMQAAMAGWSDATRVRYGVAAAKECASLTNAAQGHANHLAYYGYAGSGGHTFGNGTSQGRAAAAGFQGTLVGPGGILGEILACGQRSPQEAFASWERRDSDHYRALLGPTYNACGFGHARNRNGDIWVAMYGTDTRPAAARFSEAAGDSKQFPAAFLVNTGPVQGPQQTPQQAPAKGYQQAPMATCGPGGCTAAYGRAYYQPRRGVRACASCGGSGRYGIVRRLFRR